MVVIEIVFSVNLVGLDSNYPLTLFQTYFEAWKIFIIAYLENFLVLRIIKLKSHQQKVISIISYLKGGQLWPVKLLKFLILQLIVIIRFILAIIIAWLKLELKLPSYIILYSHDWIFVANFFGPSMVDRELCIKLIVPVNSLDHSRLTVLQYAYKDTFRNHAYSSGSLLSQFYQDDRVAIVISGRTVQLVHVDVVWHVEVESDNFIGGVDHLPINSFY